MQKYNFDFNEISDKKFNEISDKKFLEKYLSRYEEEIKIINSFGIAKAKEILDKKSLVTIGEDYMGESAVFVPMDYYCLINNEENAFTYGIGSCCGLVIFKENSKFLMHISPKHSTDDILILLKSLNLSSNGEIYIFPGNACEFGRSGNQINYKQLANKLELLNNDVYVRNFNSISGSVYLLNNKLVIGDDEPYYIKNFENSNGFKK